MKVRVTVPATTANLGPGFDCLGLALSLTNTLELEQTTEGKGWRVEIDGVGEKRLARDERNLIVRAARAVFTLKGYEPPGAIVLRAHNRIPLSSGLGSSAAAIVSGMAAANALLGGAFPRGALFEQMVQSEGHPDNVAPAFLGGLTAAFYSAGLDGRLPTLMYKRYEPHPDLRVVVLHPNFEISTAMARDILPEKVERRGAVENVARVPFLIDALTSGELGELGFLTEDHLHEPYRKRLIKGWDEIVEAGVTAGAKAVVLSGSGPAMAAFCDHRDGVEQDVAHAMEAAVEDNGHSAETFILSPHTGTEVEVEE